MNTMKNPPFGDQGLGFQTHALQMILFGPFYVRTQHYYGSLQIVSLQMSIDFCNTIVRWALHPHFKDFLFHCFLDGSTIFSGCLPSRWQKKLRLLISPFFFLETTFLNCKTISICIIFIENESFFFTKKTLTNKRL